MEEMNTHNQEIVNRVANSPLITFNLEEYYHPGERIIFDIKDWLFQGLVLREKDFRASVKGFDWSAFKECNVALTCSVDAIIPVWAWVLITTNLAPFANRVVWGDALVLEQALFQEALSKVDLKGFWQKKVVIKGCGNLPVPPSAYVEITRLLTPVVDSLMFGEPCSTVPIYKRPKTS
jgi:hypothetical protein